MILLRILVAAAALAWAAPAGTGSDRAWEERFRLFSVGAHYGLNYHGTTFIIALRMFENGADPNLLGHDNLEPNREGDACPAIAPRDRRIAQAHIAFLRALQTWALGDPWRRKEFMAFFAVYYHAGGGAKDPEIRDERNAAYARSMREVYRRAQSWMIAHGLDAMKTTELHPFQVRGDVSGTVWEP